MNIDFPSYIAINETIERYGYDPKELAPGSSKLVVCRCEICNEYRETSRGDARSKCKICRYVSVKDRDYTGVNVKKTKLIYGYDITKINHISKLKVVTVCVECSHEKGHIIYMNVKKYKLCKVCAHRGKTASQETRNKMSEARKGLKNANYGRRWSEELKKRVSELKKGKPLSEEHKKAISRAQTGKKFSPERIENMAALHRGKKRSEQSRKNISKAVLKNYEKGQIAPWKGKTLPKEMVQRISQTKIERGSHKGENNYWFGKKGSLHPAFGKTPKGRSQGKGSWYIKQDGSRVWMRSTWEVAYATFLDSKKVAWLYESKSFPILIKDDDGNNIETTYRPDFLINGTWVEIKGWWRNIAKAKFEAFKAQYPEERIALLMKDDLLTLGIAVK